MNIEKLKLILETFNSAGETAGELFIWYLAAELIPNILLFVFGIILLYIIIRVARYVGQYCIGHKTCLEMRRLQHGRRCYTPLTPSDCAEILKAFVRGLEREK